MDLIPFELQMEIVFIAFVVMMSDEDDRVEDDTLYNGVIPFLHYLDSNVNCFHLRAQTTLLLFLRLVLFCFCIITKIETIFQFRFAFMITRPTGR